MAATSITKRCVYWTWWLLSDLPLLCPAVFLLSSNLQAIFHFIMVLNNINFDLLWTLLNSLLVLFIQEIYYTLIQNAIKITDAMLYCRGFPVIVFAVILVAVRPFHSAFYFYCLSPFVSVFFMSLNSQNIFSCFNFTPQSRSPTWNLYCILAHRGSYKSHCFHTSGL